MTAATGARPGCLLVSTRALCARQLGRQGEDVAGLDRSFVTPGPGEYDAVAWATPRPGPALDAVLIARDVRPGHRRARELDRGA